MSENDNTNTENENLFNNLGLDVKFAEVEVGQIYPIYGAITKIISEDLGNVVVEINYNIQATMNIHEQDKLDLLKNRSFDSGIFVCTILEKDPTIKADCSTVIFGKNNNTVQ